MSPGDKLGSYQIVSALGAGGMGEVWRARDGRLNRDVALKLVPAEFARDEQRMARFEREAQVLASLNHPNIAAIYGFEESEGRRALVMELVEGPTLADRLANGPLPIEEALPIARQIAEAVEYAHEKGIIHRDLKPANVKITPDGAVKVLDFGLAKAMAGDTLSADPGSSPTLTMKATQLGMILGTAGYMAPEQARGAAVDRRADVWSFGVVLWEMLTGRRMFEGGTVSDTLAAVLRGDIDLTALPATTPSSIRTLLRRCLERDRKKRLPDLGAARLEIEEALQAPPEPAPSPAKTRSAWLPWAVASLALAAAAAGWLLRPKPAAAPLAQLELHSPAGTTLGPELFHRYALSPDGSKLVFAATSSKGRRQLYLRDLDQVESRPLPGTEDAIGPFWAPDSRWLAFFNSARIVKIDTLSGQTAPLCAVKGSGTGSWNRDGVILFTDGEGPVKRTLASGGEAARALELDAHRGESSHRDPFFLPDGRQFLYGCFGKQAGVCLASLDSNQGRFLFVQRNSPAHFAQASGGKGYLLFTRGPQLLAQEFDLGKRELRGEAKSLVEPVGTGPCWSASNTDVLVTRRFFRGTTELVWYSREGKPVKIANEAASFDAPRLSPDGKRVVFSRPDTSGANLDLWILDLDRNTTTRFTFESGYNGAGIWSPDGQRIAYYSNRGEERVVVERSASGVGKEEVLLRTEDAHVPRAYSRDGRWLLLRKLVGGKTSLHILSRQGEPKLSRFQDTEFQDRGGMISPDGRWIVYDSNQTGRWEVFVQNLPESLGGAPGPTGKWQISSGGGGHAVWRADGREIFYLDATGRMMSTPVESVPGGLRPGKAEMLFQTRLSIEESSRNFDVSADGKRFLLADPTEDSVNVPFTVILNWPKLLVNR